MKRYCFIITLAVLAWVPFTYLVFWLIGFATSGEVLYHLVDSAGWVGYTTKEITTWIGKNGSKFYEGEQLGYWFTASLTAAVALCWGAWEMAKWLVYGKDGKIE